MLTMKVDESTPSEDKSPSPELFSLIKAAAESLAGFGELWGTIKKKGADEGFKEADLQDMLRPLLRDRLGMNKDKIYYLFHKEEVKARTTERYDKMADAYRKKTTINVDKVIEQPTIPTEPPKDPDEDEEPTPFELAEIEIAQLKDALKKTEQFKPATQLQPTAAITEDDQTSYKWLMTRADGIHSFYYDAYGIDLFKNRELSQLKNSGVKVFKRLYFEV